MEELREALMRLFAESIGVADELSDEEANVRETWNRVLPEFSISDDDLEDLFD